MLIDFILEGMKSNLKLSVFFYHSENESPGGCGFYELHFQKMNSLW